MKNRIILSLFFVFLGLMIILFPIYILPVCPHPDALVNTAHGINNQVANTGHMHTGAGKIMKCFWTARAELGIGALIIVIGTLMLLSRTIFVRLGLSMALACISLLAIAIPTILIGVCSNEMMRCNMGAKPALVLLSGILFVVSILNSLYLNKLVKKN
ncbi:DUF4418 family protein [Gilliamella sp. G0441]|uniref:DUF4418 family protein n=1 Tax=Gilliamella sp. G0441 TaxID=3384760 RepID=UPI0025D4BB62|nr:DUF4418 family protein [uncultured Gilliamella sp.]